MVRGVEKSKPAKTLGQRLRRLVIIIFMTVAIIVLPLAFYAWHFLYLPMGEGPAGAAVAREPFTQPWTDRPVLVVGIGDSITDGYGATPGKSYWQRLLRNPPDELDDMRGICLSSVLPRMESLELAVSTTTSTTTPTRRFPRSHRNRPMYWASS